MVLMVSLLMLLVTTLITVSADTVVRGNLKAVENTQSREWARAGAQAAIEEALSSQRFFESPNSIYSADCGQSNRKCYDFNEDEIDDVRVHVTPPRCVMVTPLLNTQLRDLPSPTQENCLMPGAGYSLCAKSIWEIEAIATSEATGAEITVRQGVSVLTALNRMESNCPL